MVQFDELMHAWIAAKYHSHLTGKYGEQGKNAFFLAVRHYALQRGRRMAERAVRDGKELNYRTYQEYGEWKNTEHVVKEELANKSEILSRSPDLVTKITRCPWHEQFRRMGMEKAGSDYCRYLDASIAAGFSPEIRYEVSCTLNEGPYCLHTVKDVYYAEDETHPKKEGMQKDFTYHCAHSYWAMRTVTESIFSEEGTKICEKILEEMAEEYSREAADTIRSFRDTDFESIR